MAEKKKPQEDLVAIAGRAMKNPETLSGSYIKRMAARILDDQRNDPEPNAGKPSLASQVVAAVAELLPGAAAGSDKTKPAPKAKNGPTPKGESAPASSAPDAAKTKPAVKAPEASAKVKAAPSDEAPAKPASKRAPAKAKPAAKAKTASKG